MELSEIPLWLSFVYLRVLCGKGFSFGIPLFRLLGFF